MFYAKLTVSADPLPLKRPRDRIMPAKERDLKLVNRGLWSTFLRVCNGELPWPLYVHGPVGTGKSCAALCLADRIERAQFHTMPLMTSHYARVKEGKAWWSDGADGGWMTEKYWCNQVSSWPLLLLDEVGSREFPTEDHVEALYVALNARDGRPVICTSNLKPDALESQYGDRVRSRACNGTVYELQGRDRRYDNGLGM